MAMPARRLATVDTSTRTTVFSGFAHGSWREGCCQLAQTAAPRQRQVFSPRRPLDGAPASAYTTGKIRQPVTRLYLISPERIEHPSIFADELRAALDGGDVAAFQLRLKDVRRRRDRPRRRHAAADLPAARRRLHPERPARPRGEARLRRRPCRPGRHVLCRGAPHRRARPPGRRHLQGLARTSPWKRPKPAPTTWPSARSSPRPPRPSPHRPTSRSSNGGAS